MLWRWGFRLRPPDYGGQAGGLGRGVFAAGPFGFAQGKPVAGAAAGAVVAVPGPYRNEFNAAAGVGAAYKGVGEGFWDAPRTRNNAFCTHFAPPAGLPYGGRSQECHRSKGDV